MRLHIIRGAVIAASLAVAPLAHAQTALSNFEVGAGLSTLRVGDSGTTSAGVGARVSYDFANWIAAEGEFNFFPRDRFDSVSGGSPDELTVRYSRQRYEAFFGPKIGIRGERFGAFAKVRPGFVRLTDRGVACVGEACNRLALLMARPVYRTEAALDLGGVLEFYPTARTVARLDLGATAVRHRSQAPPCNGCTRTSFSSGLGFGVRF